MLPAALIAHRSRARAILAATLALLAGTVLVSCGLPSIRFVGAPENPRREGATPSQTRFLFEHNTANDFGDFQGYELYYKLYRVDAASIESDANAIETTPRQPGPSRLVNRGYARLMATTLRTANLSVSGTITFDAAPHLPIDPTTTPITFTVDLREPQIREATPDTTVDSAEITVQASNGAMTTRGLRRRNVDRSSSDPTGEFEPFWHRSRYDAADYDVARMLPEPDGGYPGDPDITPVVTEVVVVLYVLAYGTDGNTFAPFWSEPVRLGEATIVTNEP